MSKKPDADLGLKLRFRRILFAQGYWTPIEIELSQYKDLGTTTIRRSLTDLDVLGVKFDNLFSVHRIVCDCKSGKNVSDVTRLFWLRGVVDYFGADEAYFLRPRIDWHARAIAPKLGLRAIGENDIDTLEDSLNIKALKLPLADLSIYNGVRALWGIDVPKGGTLTELQKKKKDIYSYLSYAFWYIDRNRNILMLIDKYNSIAGILNPSDPRDVLLAYTGLERFAFCLMDIANHIHAQGGGDIPRLARTYIFGGPMGLKEKENFFALLRRATGSTEQLDPPWMEDIIELIGRLIRNPTGASDVLRHLSSFFLWCVFMGNITAPEVQQGTINTAAIVLAKDIAAKFTRSTGMSASIFKTIQNL